MSTNPVILCPMRNTFKIRFYCRPAKIRKSTGEAPVECSVIVSGERQIITLPRSCKPEDFPTPDLKIYCHGVENKINEIYTALSVADEPISAFILKDIYINGARRVSYPLKKMFEDGLRLKAQQGGDISTYRKYEHIQERFTELTEIPLAREAGSVTHADILKFKAGLDKIHKPQTVHKEMMHLKYFFLLAFNSGKIRRNPFASIKIRKPEVENIFLTQEEVGRIRDLRIANERLSKVRDLALFMAFSGLEYADMCELEPEDFQEKNGLVFIKKKRVKTGVEYISVLYEDAVELREVYGGKIPVISCQKFNFYLKEIQEKAKIEKNLTSIIFRHTYGTYLLQKGLSLDIVSKMLGHTNQEQTRTYASLLDETVLKANAGLARTVTPSKPSKPVTGQTGGSGDEDWEKELEEIRKLLLGD